MLREYVQGFLFKADVCSWVFMVILYKVVHSQISKGLFENHEWMLNVLNYFFFAAIEIIILLFSLNLLIAKSFTFLGLNSALFRCGLMRQ